MRQLLNCESFTKGHHEVKWDGLTTAELAATPGDPVPARQVHLGGDLPWGDRPQAWSGGPATAGRRRGISPPGRGNWGGDHGSPVLRRRPTAKASISAGRRAEAGKALLGCDADGNVRWNNTHGGIAGAPRVAVDHGTVYVQRETEPDAHQPVVLYRLKFKRWDLFQLVGQRQSTDLEILTARCRLAAGGGRIFLAYGKLNQIQVARWAEAGKPAEEAGRSRRRASFMLQTIRIRLDHLQGQDGWFRVDIASGQPEDIAGRPDSAAAAISSGPDGPDLCRGAVNRTTR